jgi:hypothetical protein
VPFVVDAPLQNINAKVMQAAVKEAKQQAALVRRLMFVRFARLHYTNMTASSMHVNMRILLALLHSLYDSHF